MPNLKKQQINWADEEPFFSFDIPYGGLIVFDDGNVVAAENDLINSYEEDNLIPGIRMTDLDDPYIKTMELNKPPKFKDKKIQCIILPIRYTKVFKT